MHQRLLCGGSKPARFMYIAGLHAHPAKWNAAVLAAVKAIKAAILPASSSSGIDSPSAITSTPTQRAYDMDGTADSSNSGPLEPLPCARPSQQVYSYSHPSYTQSANSSACSGSLCNAQFSKLQSTLTQAFPVRSLTVA